MKVKVEGIALLMLVSILGCSHGMKSDETPMSSDTQRVPAQAGARLPDHDRWAYLEEISGTLNLSASNLELKMSSGGTSVYAVLIRDGKAIGGLLPENEATSISGEIMTFNLARALGFADLYQPAIYHLLKGSNLEAFRKFIPTTPFKAKIREKNRKRVLADIGAHPAGIHTVFKEFGIKPVNYDGLVNESIESFNENHVMKGSATPFGKFLKCNGPMPSSSVQVTANGGTSNEYDLARELSSIFLIDALTQEYDRFSGGNLQTLTGNGRVKFIAYDNGGTWGGMSYTRKFLSYVSRFDRKVAEGILDMERLFTEGREFMGLRNEAEFAQAMGIERLPGVMPGFKSSLKLVADHIRKNPGCYF